MLIVEADSPQSAESALIKLPLFANGIVSLELIELHPSLRSIAIPLSAVSDDELARVLADAYELAAPPDTRVRARPAQKGRAPS